jgi:endonuclease/exonuclease/phosphatase family metal-dependent hydrolase
MTPIKFLLCIISHGLLIQATFSAEPLKAMTWNIKWFPGGFQEATKADKTEHIKAASLIIEKTKPDIFLAQEIRDEQAFRNLIKNHPTIKPHILTKFMEFDGKTPSPQQCAIASNLELHSGWQESFKSTKKLPGLQRGFAFAALKHPDGGLIMVYCIHLRSNRGSENPQEAKKIAATRAESVRQIIAHKNEMMNKFSREKIVGWVIGGDFNTNHDGQFPLCSAINDMVKAGFHNTWNNTPQKDRITWRNNPRFEDFKPTTFDYIFTSGFTKNQATTVPNVSLKVSDHAPVMLNLSVP